MSAPEQSAPHRRSYGRGFFDGLRTAGIDNPEEFLNAQKQQRVEDGLTAIMRKVYDAVPEQDPWTVSQIVAEISRITRSSMDHRTVLGVLGQLKERGLVKEPASKEFIRAKHRHATLAVVDGRAEPAEAIAAPTELNVAPIVGAPMPALDAVTEQQEPMDRLAALAALMRDMAEQMAKSAREAEDVALEVEQRMERIKADTLKLRQLQALLKDIGQ